jgi:hypothetical protein
MFEHDYLELRGIIDPELYTHNLGAFLERREGLMGVALATENADACHTALVNRGFDLAPVRELTRSFELPEGHVKLRFSLCLLEPDDAYGLMWVVLCRHLTPELLRQPAWLNHANGATGVTSVIGVAPDLERAYAAQVKLFGDAAVRRTGEEVRVELGGRQSLMLTTAERLRRLYPYVEMLVTGDEPMLAVVGIRVHDLSTTEDWLALQKIERGRTSSGSVCTSPKEGCGVILEFVGATEDSE